MAIEQATSTEQRAAYIVDVILETVERYGTLGKKQNGSRPITFPTIINTKTNDTKGPQFMDKLRAFVAKELDEHAKS